MVKITKKDEHETVTAYYRLAPSYMAVINRFDYVELFTHYECFLFMINWWTDVPCSRVSFQLLILVNENVVRNSVSIVCHFFVFITF